MHPNLDEKIEYLRDKSLKQKNLDVLSDNELKYADLYQDYYAKKKNFVTKSNVSFEAIPVRRKRSIIDIGTILTADDNNFVRTVYQVLLGRDAEEEAVTVANSNLKEKKLTRVDFINATAESAEFKSRNIVLTGYKKLPIAVFLQYTGREFIDNAYILILKRFADDQAMNNYLKLLGRGNITPVEILYDLNHSPEGINNNLVIEGLDELYAKRQKHMKFYRIPVIGKVARMLNSLRYVNSRINTMSDALVDLEDRTVKDSERLASEINSLQTNMVVLNDNIGKLREQISLVSRSNVANANAISEVSANLSRINDSLGSTINDIGRNVSDLNGVSEDYHENKVKVGNDLAAISSDVAVLTSEISNLRVQLKRLKDAPVSNALVSEGEALAPQTVQSVPVSDENRYESIDYFDFENHFRGSREHIKKSQEMYLPYFENRQNVVDLGCGRGEFVELLLDNKIGVTGVDMYEPYVEFMKMHGLPAVYDDAVSYLKKQDKVDGIFVGQVVEHISVEQIIELCKTAYEKLDDGAYLIMETPNPRSLAIFTNFFYVDPSHQRPVHPFTLEYLVKKAGFTSVEIMYTENSKVPFSIPKLKENDPDYSDFNNAMGEVSNLLYGSQDYAIIARK